MSLQVDRNEPLPPTPKPNRESLVKLAVTCLAALLVALAVFAISSYKNDIVEILQQRNFSLPTTDYFKEQWNSSYAWVDQKVCGHHIHQNITNCVCALKDSDENDTQVSIYKQQENLVNSVVKSIDTIDAEIVKLKHYKRQLLLV